MESIVLQAELRGVGRHPLRELREAARVPAIVYGAGVEAQAIALDARALGRALRSAGSSLVSLQIAGQPPVQVLAREVQRDPIKRYLLHVDFQVVSMTETLRLHISIAQRGVAPVTGSPDVVLVRHTDSVEIECLPADIPGHLEADMTVLKELDDQLLAGDLILPQGVKLVTDPTHVVYSVTLARAAVEEEEVAEVAAPIEVEVVAKGKAAKGEEVIPEE